jgi:DNA-binding winged helix-turn-helix (wHTH) protein/Tol biopolymer transport system component
VAIEPKSANIVRFGLFEADLQARELRKGGIKLKLHEQPFEVLAALLERPGQVVTREELRRKLWRAETFVDFDHSINTAVNKLREVLGDSAENSRFVETLARRGYRFIAPVDARSCQSAANRNSQGNGQNGDTPASSFPLRPSARRLVRLVGTITVLLGSLIATWFMVRGPQRLPDLKLQRLTASSAERPVLGAVISPDGKYLAWSDAIGIHLTLIGTGETHLIARPKTLAADNAWIPVAWFPDGTRLVANSVGPATKSQRTVIWVVPVLGGPAIPLRDRGLAGAISADGTKIAFLSGGDNLDHEIWLMGARGEDAHKIATAEGTSLFAYLHWSPNNHRIGYVRIVPRHYTYEYLIESRDIEVSTSTAVLQSLGDLTDFCWLPTGRVVYPVSEQPPNNRDANLWQVQVDPQTGRPRSKPGRITNWPGFSFDNFSASADGKRIAFQKWSGQINVYVGRRQATRLESPRRLTLDEHIDLPYAWMPDSKAILFVSNRNGRGGIFKQPLDEELAESVAVATEDIYMARVSSDGSWILFLSPANGRLMRVPVSGGAPQLVMETKGTRNFDCARAPSTLCVITEVSVGLKELIFTSFDPVRGRGRELFRLPWGQGAGFGSALAHDGSGVAVVEYLGKSIQLFSITGRHERDINPKGWTKLSNVDWDLDDKALFVSSHSPTTVSLLWVDLAGNVQVLWTQEGSTHTFGIPSPDGRYLALGGWISDRNVWMAEYF